MNIENLMQGITNQNLAQAELIKLRAENDQLKADQNKLKLKIQELEANQYESGKYIPISLAELALEAQKKYFESELEVLKNARHS